MITNHNIAACLVLILVGGCNSASSLRGQNERGAEGFGTTESVRQIAIVEDPHTDIAAIEALGDGGYLVVLGEKVSSGELEKVTGGMILPADGQATIFWIGADGLPEAAVWDDWFLYFENYTKNSVDLIAVDPDGVIDAKTIALDPALLSTLDDRQPISLTSNLDPAGESGLMAKGWLDSIKGVYQNVVNVVNKGVSIVQEALMGYARGGIRGSGIKPGSAGALAGAGGAIAGLLVEEVFFDSFKIEYEYTTPSEFIGSSSFMSQVESQLSEAENVRDKEKNRRQDRKYTLDIEVEGCGSIETAPSDQFFREGEEVRVTAVPCAGWEFLLWRGDVSGNASSAPVVVRDKDFEAEAVFGIEAGEDNGNDESNNDGPGAEIDTSENDDESTVDTNHPDSSAGALVTLEVGDSYDFLTQVHGYPNAGDFYFAASKFLANNLHQKGVTSLGNLGDGPLEDVSIPLAGYTLFGVPAVTGHTYVALRREPLHGQYVVFRVIDVTAEAVTFEYTLRDVAQ